MNNKVTNYIKENYKLMIPIALLLVVFIAFLVYYKISIDNNYHIDKEENVYQYFHNQKYEYTAIVSKNKKDVIVDYKPNNKNINIDSTPVYYKDKEIVIFPKNMSVVMPTLGQEYLSPGYSYIVHNKNTYNLITTNYNNRLNHYFLFDGKNLYFFIEPVTLKVGKEEIKLSSLSYLIAKNDSYITYYDKKSDTSKTLTNITLDDYIKNDYYKVYINKDTIDYQGSNVLIGTDIEKLNTIDKKGKK